MAHEIFFKAVVRERKFAGFFNFYISSSSQVTCGLKIVTLQFTYASVSLQHCWTEHKKIPSYFNSVCMTVRHLYNSPLYMHAHSEFLSLSFVFLYFFSMPFLLVQTETDRRAVQLESRFYDQRVRRNRDKNTKTNFPTSTTKVGIYHREKNDDNKQRKFILRTKIYVLYKEQVLSFISLSSLYGLELSLS